MRHYEREKLATRRVIEAIPENNKTWKPGEKSRSAEELAWHIASVEVGMLQGIGRLSFMSLHEEEEFQKSPPKTIAEIANWYDANLPKAIEAVKKLSAGQLLTPVDFHGAFNSRPSCISNS